MLVVSLLLSLSACGAKSEPVYEGEYASQEAFLEAMAKGISNRLKNVDDEKQRTDEEKWEYFAGLVNYELEQIEMYEDLVFEDSLFNELAHGYIGLPASKIPSDVTKELCDRFMALYFE